MLASMHTVVFTPIFLAQVKRSGISGDDLNDIATTVSSDPQGGDLMAGTGGARKMRHAGRGRGKSGGYRTIHYWGGDDVPVFLLAMYGKGEKSNLTKGERNELASILPRIAKAYRKEDAT